MDASEGNDVCPYCGEPVVIPPTKQVFTCSACRNRLAVLRGSGQALIVKGGRDRRIPREHPLASLERLPLRGKVIAMLIWIAFLALVVWASP